MLNYPLFRLILQTVLIALLGIVERLFLLDAQRLVHDGIFTGQFICQLFLAVMRSLEATSLTHACHHVIDWHGAQEVFLDDHVSAEVELWLQVSGSGFLINYFLSLVIWQLTTLSIFLWHLNILKPSRRRKLLAPLLGLL